MSTDTTALENTLAELTRALSAAERTRLLRHIGTELAHSNRTRMAAQHGPEGEPWQPRKPRLASRHGKDRAVRQTANMMLKLRTARHLAVKNAADGVELGWRGIAGFIASVHHYGLDDRVSKTGPRISYPARPLLGISENDRRTVRSLILEHLSKAG